MTLVVIVAIIGLAAAVGCVFAVSEARPALGFVSVLVVLLCVWLLVRLGAVHP